MRHKEPGWKRLLDVGGAIFGLITLAPLLLVIGALVYVFLGHPVLFKQIRPGKGGRPFTLYKFRTMRNLCGADGRPLPDQLRMTKLGAWLRSSSLDELPELWNVLKGEMSLVGPRPLLLDYLTRYSAEQRHRHDVLPGLTGLAQVNGRNHLSWEQKFEYDLYYVRHLSLSLDLRILALTVVRVLQRRGISQEGQATADCFLGREAAAERKA